MPVPPEAARPADELLDRLSEIIRLVSGRDVEVRPEHAFVDDLRIDSLAMVEILEAAGSHFGVDIGDEATRYFVRVRDLVDYLGGRRPAH